MKNRDDSYLIGNKFAKKHDQPKPTGEWTAEHVQEMCKLALSGYDSETIADAHNAELAAARERRERAEEWSATLAKLADDNTVSYNATCDQLRDQLSVERELREKLTLSWTLSKSDNQQLREQLAAEREKVQRLESGTGLNAVIETNKQLREKVQTLVEALHVLYTSKDQELRKQVYHAEIAKVEGYPLPDGRTK